MGATKNGIAAINYTHTAALSKAPIQSCDYTLRKQRKHDGTFLVELRDNVKRPRYRGTVVERDAEPISKWLEKGKTVMCTVLQAVPVGGGEGRVAWELGVKGPGVGRGMRLLEKEGSVKVKVEDVGVGVEEEGGGWNPELQSPARPTGMRVEAMERERIRLVEEAMRGIKIEEDLAEQETWAGPFLNVEEVIGEGTIVKVEEAMCGMRIKDEIDSDEGEP